MATGASTASLAVLLIDARYGLQVQTRRHSFICHLLGIKQFVIAVNKMDLVGYSEDTYNQIEAEYRSFAAQLGVENLIFIPLSALKGENVVDRSENMPWFKGQPLLSELETVSLVDEVELKQVRFPVQYVNRPNLNFRGYCGTLASGTVHPGQEIRVLPSKKVSKIKRIVAFKHDLDEAIPGDAVTLTLEDEIDISRGDMIVGANDEVHISNALQVDVVWMHEKPLEIGKNYTIKFGASEVSGCVTEIIHTVNVNTLEQGEASGLQLNEIARCRMELTESVVVDPYRNSRFTGNLIFIDRLSNITVGAGMVFRALGQENIVWHNMDVNKGTRADRFKQKPAIIWFTGLSGSGKSTTANALERQLFAMGYNTYLLDGDNVRHGLCSDLGFGERDRAENIRRVGELAKLMVDAGLIVLASFISPFKRERQMVRQMMEPGEFFECFVDTPLNVCEERDPKGLYKKAREGRIKQFTGIDSPYEAPENPEITVNTYGVPTEETVAKLIPILKEAGIIH